MFLGRSTDFTLSRAECLAERGGTDRKIHHIFKHAVSRHCRNFGLIFKELFSRYDGVATSFLESLSRGADWVNLYKIPCHPAREETLFS